LTALLSLTWGDTTLNFIWSCCTWGCTCCVGTSSLGSSRFVWFSSSIVLVIFFLIWRRVLNQTFLWWWKFHVMLLQWTRWGRVHTKKEAFLGQLRVWLCCNEAFRVGCRTLLPELDLTLLAIILLNIDFSIPTTKSAHQLGLKRRASLCLWDLNKLKRYQRSLEFGVEFEILLHFCIYDITDFVFIP